MKYILVLILLIGNLCFCQNNQTTAKFQKIKSVIHSHPEQAKEIILEILSAKGKLHDTILSDAYKNYGIYHNVKGNRDSTLYYHKKSLNLAKKYPKKYIQGLINLADTYRKLNDLPKAAQLLNEAEKVSLTNNNILLGRVYSAKGSVYNYMLKGEEAFKYLHKSIEYLKKDNDFEMLMFAQASLAGSYMYQENFTFAIDLYKEALTGFKKNNHLQNYYVTLINYADCHIYINKPQIAIKALQEAVAGFEQLGNEHLLVNALWKLAKAEAITRNFNVAAATYERTQKLAIKNRSERTVNITAEYIKLLLEQKKYNNIPDVIDQLEKSSLEQLAFPEDKILYEQQKANFYEKTAQSTEAVYALKEAFRLRDSLDAVHDNDEIRELQAKFQTELQREKNIILEKDNQRLKENSVFENKIFWLSIAIIFFVLLGALIFIALLKSRNKLQKESLKGMEAQRRLILQERENELQQNQLLQKDLELKKIALQSAEAQIRNFLIRIEQNNEHVEKLNRELAVLNDNNASEELIIRHKAKLDELLSKAIITDEKWDSFLKFFNEVHPDYLQKIIQKLPGLTPAETRYILLRKLNLSAREIATVLGVQPDAIRLYKHRLRKKYGFTDDTQLDAVLE